MMERKAILFIINGLERGGSEMRLLDFARHFPPDLEIHILVTSERLSLLNDFTKTGAKMVVAPIKRGYFAFSAIRRLIAYITAHDIEIVNSFDLKGLIVSAWIKLFKRDKLRTVHHFVDLLHDSNSRQRFALWRLMRWMDHVVCNSVEVKNEVVGQRSLAASVTVINNGVDTEHFDPDRANTTKLRGPRDRGSLGFDDSHFVIGTVANFRPEKNYPFLIESFKRLHSTYPSSRLLCVGGGPSLAAVGDMVRSCNLNENVRFTGYVQDVRTYLAAMDVFVLCSVKEGFPNAVLQAMSMGVPVICSNVGECKNIVKDGESGLLFDVSEPDQFLNAVISVIEDRVAATRMAEVARRTAEQEYSMHTMIHRYVAYFRAM